MPTQGIVFAMNLEEKEARLREILAGYGSMGIAFSGGVDSSFLAAFAEQVLPGKVLLLTAHSPSFPESEAKAVAEFATQHGIRLHTVDTNELAIKQYGENPPSRCFFCKTEMYSTLKPIALAEGMAVLADGANLDDKGDFRPGAKAAEQWDVMHPLQEAQMTKADIRELSRRMELPTWDKPAFACLASRIPYGEHINKEKLDRVGRAEAAIQGLGYRVFRVRSHGDLARLELGAEELDRGFSEREAITGLLKKAGFLYVTLDLQGFRSGSMNEALQRAGIPADPVG